MAGRIREVDTRDIPAILGFHNTRAHDGIATDKPDDMVQRLDRYTKRRLNGMYREIVRKSFGADEGLLFLFAQTGNTQTVDQVRHCAVGSGANLNNCDLLPRVTAVELGIVDRR